MAIIMYERVNMKDLREQVVIFNNSKLLEVPIETKVGVKKTDMADNFVKGIEYCNAKGTLDEVPESVYMLYTTIVSPEDGSTPEPAQEGGPQEAPAGPKKEPKPKKEPAPPKERKVTRAETFASLLIPNSPTTKGKLEEEMRVTYNGSEAEAKFWTGAYVALLLACGKMQKDKDGVLIYTP